MVSRTDYVINEDNIINQYMVQERFKPSSSQSIVSKIEHSADDHELINDHMLHEEFEAQFCANITIGNKHQFL